MYSDLSPKFVKQYANLSPLITGAIEKYIEEVKDLSFPEEKHVFSMDDALLQKLY